MTRKKLEMGESDMAATLLGEETQVDRPENRTGIIATHEKNGSLALTAPVF